MLQTQKEKNINSFSNHTNEVIDIGIIDQYMLG